MVLSSCPKLPLYAGGNAGFGTWVIVGNYESSTSVDACHSHIVLDCDCNLSPPNTNVVMCTWLPSSWNCSHPSNAPLLLVESMIWGLALQWEGGGGESQVNSPHNIPRGIFLEQCEASEMSDGE